MQQVVVAYDFSRSAEVALERALEIACRAPQHILHVVTALEPGTALERAEVIQGAVSRRIDELLEGRVVADDVQFFVHARIGQPVGEILDLAQDVGADLIVIGSHGRTGLKRFLLGSVSEEVVRGARCPVVIARDKGYRDVELEQIVDAPEDGHVPYIKPHRYAYSIERQVIGRPPEWPII